MVRHVSLVVLYRGKQLPCQSDFLKIALDVFDLVFFESRVGPIFYFKFHGVVGNYR